MRTPTVAVSEDDRDRMKIMSRAEAETYGEAFPSIQPVKQLRRRSQGGRPDILSYYLVYALSQS